MSLQTAATQFAAAWLRQHPHSRGETFHVSGTETMLAGAADSAKSVTITIRVDEPDEPQHPLVVEYSIPVG